MPYGSMDVFCVGWSWCHCGSRCCWIWHGCIVTPYCGL